MPDPIVIDATIVITALSVAVIIEGLLIAKLFRELGHIGGQSNLALALLHPSTPEDTRERLLEAYKPEFHGNLKSEDKGYE